MNVREYLQTQCVPFEIWPHEPTYTAQHLAQELDVPGINVAKTVLLNVDNEFCLAVLPATHQISLPKLKERLHAKTVHLATEEEVARVFPDCEPGVAPPFGDEYGMPTLVDESLTQDEHIVFEGNSHDEAVYVKYEDYAHVAHPRVESFTMHAG